MIEINQKAKPIVPPPKPHTALHLEVGKHYVTNDGTVIAMSTLPGSDSALFGTVKFRPLELPSLVASLSVAVGIKRIWFLDGTFLLRTVTELQVKEEVNAPVQELWDHWAIHGGDLEYKSKNPNGSAWVPYPTNAIFPVPFEGFMHFYNVFFMRKVQS